MKQLKLSILLTLFLGMVGSKAFADREVYTDGLYFNVDISHLTATVTSMPSPKHYMGSRIIPTEVEYAHKECKVTEIGYGAFRDCSQLTSVTIPNTITVIGGEAFRNCIFLPTINIPNSVTDIGARTFENCNSLTIVIVNISTPLSIGVNTFTNRTNATLFVPKNSRADYMAANYWQDFQNIVEIYNIKFTDSQVKSLCVSKWDTNGDRGLSTAEAAVVKSLGKVFQNNTVIKNINELQYFISLTSIDDRAFDGCTSLTSIEIPDFVTNIGEYTFNGCISLTSVTIPNSVTSIGESAFFGCDGLTSVTVDIETPLPIGSSTFSNRMNAVLYVPYGSKAAYEAADYWKEFKEIVEMVPPSPAIEFADTNVKDLCVANWDTDGDGELSEAEAAAVTDLGQVFKGNKKLTSFEELGYFTGLISIGNEAFSGCSGLTSVTIPNSVTSIDDRAFQECSGLTSIAIPNNVTSIGSDAFYDCSGLTLIDIPNSVTSIGDWTFSNCSSLTSITFPNSVTSFGYSVFSGCSDLTSISVGSGNTKYDTRDNCNAIIETASNTLIASCKTTIIPNSVTSISNGAFSGCSGLTSIVIPNSVTSIGDRAFYLCLDLTSITIPNSVTSIGSSAFNGCSGLTSIEIPNSVTSIDDGAFFGCWNLTSVTIDIETPLSITSYTFSNRANATLYVPKGSKATYENANYWKEFKEIVEVEEELSVEGDADGDGFVDVNDVTSTINYILKKSVKTFIKEAADMDKDGKIDVNDVQAIIYKALGKDKTYYYYYVGPENPMEMTSISPIVTSQAEAGWYKIGETLGTYSLASPLIDASDNMIPMGSRTYDYIALPNNILGVYNVLGASEMEGYTFQGTKVLGGITYYVYKDNTLIRYFGQFIY